MRRWLAAAAAALAFVTSTGAAAQTAGDVHAAERARFGFGELRRGADGWVGVERTFRFEYSHDGADRHVGRLVLHGTQMVGFAGPVAPP